MRRIALMVLLLAGCGGSDGAGGVNPDAGYEPDGGYPRAAVGGRASGDAVDSAQALPRDRSLRRADLQPAPGTPFRAQHRAQHQ